jgi:amino acid transporter
MLFYLLVSYAQVVGFGLGSVPRLSHANAPLDELSTRFISGTFAGFLYVGAATSALTCTIGSLAGGARILYALARTGFAPSLAEINAKHGTPTRSIAVIGAIDLGFLVLRGARSDVMSYSGNAVTVGTLALILVYIGVAGAQAIDAHGRRRPVWRMVGCLSAALLLWPLLNSLYPVPPWPGNVGPYVVAAWLVVGTLVVCFRPSVAQFEIHDSAPAG